MKNHLHLVVDEVVACGNRHEVRLQIWRGKGLEPVVLMIGIPGQPPPDWYTTRLATIAVRDFLGYQGPVPVFFQYSMLDGVPRAFKVEFQVHGHKLRPFLCHPKYGGVDPDAIARVFGIPAPQAKESK